MSEAFWIAVIGGISTIVAAAITAYFAYKASLRKRVADVAEKQGVIAILDPKEGDTIAVSANETRPVDRTVTGKVTGFSEDEIADLGLVVEISVYTDAWYKQTTGGQPVKVEKTGSWSAEHIKFGGHTHVLRASLLDKHGIERAKPCAINLTVPEAEIRHVNSAGLNVRIRPGAEEPIVTTLGPNEEVRLLGEMAEVNGYIWVKVAAGKDDGWVKKQYLK